jgi:hypothetical protein
MNMTSALNVELYREYLQTDSLGEDGGRCEFQSFS